MKRATLEALKNLCIDYLIKAQNTNGSFISINTRSINCKSFSEKDKQITSFATSLVLGLLKSQERLDKVIAKSKDFLLSQSSRYSSFNYWERGSVAEAEIKSDDIDDTVLAIGALTSHSNHISVGRLMADLTKLLINNEVEKGGPYCTWIISNNSPNDVDFLVNCNISWCLSLVDVYPDKLNDYINWTILEDNLISKFYPDNSVALFLISRANLDHLSKTLLLKKLELSITGISDSSCLTEMCLAYLALRNLGMHSQVTEPLYNRIIKKCTIENSLELLAVCNNPNTEAGKKQYSAIPAFNIAVLLNFLQSFDMLISLPSKRFAKTPNQYINTLISAFSLHFAGFISDAKNNSKLQNGLIKQIEHFQNFQNSLLKPNKAVHDKINQDLSLANLAGWYGFDIVDDIADQHTDCNRVYRAIHSIALSRSLFISALDGNRHHVWLEKQFRSMVISMHNDMVLQSIDRSKTYTTTDFEYQFKFTQTWKKNWGVALPYLSYLLLSGYKHNGWEFSLIMKFFQSYLQIKQLNDDAKDWHSDLIDGNFNQVSKQILFHTLNESVVKSFSYSSIATTGPTLDKIFWEKVLPSVHSQLLDLQDSNNKVLDLCNSFMDTRDFAEMMVPYKVAIVKIGKNLSEVKEYVKGLV